MSKEMKLFTDGISKNGEREFTRIMGGFGDGKPVISDKQIAELLEYKMGARQVRQQIDRNIEYFKYGQDLLDFKREDDSNTLAETLISLGYAKQSITQAKNIYILSEAGFLLYLKFAEGDKSIEIYKNFIEDYFKTKAENKVMQKTLTEEKEFLIEQKKFILGSMFMEQDDNKRMEYFKENEKISERIKEIDITLSKENLLEQLQPQLSIADKFTNTNNIYDMNTFSKILSIKGMGRNKMFEWLRQKKILMGNNQPYQKYVTYFDIIAIENRYNGKINYKTMVKAKGIKYIFEKLIKDGKIIPKSIDEVIEELKATDNEKQSA